MSKQPTARTITVHVPMRFTVHGGRKTVISKLAPADVVNARTEDALLKALAKAFRWRRLIEDGQFSSITELAKAKGVNESYACRLLRLTLLSPEIVGTILESRQPPTVTLKRLIQPLPNEWDRQPAAMVAP